MSDRLTCAACGVESYAVSTRIVEREPTPDNPDRFAAEPRCMDSETCRERVEADVEETTP